jgi:subtilisin family serine protease
MPIQADGGTRSEVDVVRKQVQRRLGMVALCVSVALVGAASTDSVSARGATGHRHAAPVLLGVSRRATGSRAASLLTDYIVRTADSAGQQRVVSWAATHHVAIAATFGSALDGATLTLPSSQVAVVRSLPGVVSVEPDRPVRLTGVEGSATWGLDRIDQRSAALDTAYHYTDTGAGVKAYVIDTGLRVTHTDFSGRVGTGSFYDFGDGKGLNDCNGHGTHTAGSLGGTLYGVAKGVTIVPVKVLDCTGSGSNTTVIAGLNWVLSDHRAGEPAVVSMSLGGTASADVDAATQKLIDAGVTVVAAAGNESADACNVSPARVPGAITVGAIGQGDAEAIFSNYGRCVDIFAPGVGITSDWWTSDTTIAMASGTSMATPHVAGAAALILQAHPTFTPAQLWALMNATATTGKITFQSFDVGSPDKLLYTGPIAAPSPPAAPTTVPGNTAITVNWNAPSSDGNMAITGYRVQRSTDGVQWVTVATAKPIARSLLVGGLGNGVAYRFRVAAVNFVGPGLDSASSVAVAPRTKPGAVGAVSTQALNGAALLTWRAPVRDGGAVVRNYRIERSNNGVTWSTVTLSAPLTRTFVVPKLTNGVSYRFRVAAANIAGVGAWSAAASSVPKPVPSSPGRPSATVHSTKVSLSWSPPVVRGAAMIKGYRLLTSVDGITWLVVTPSAPLSRSFTVAGLTNGVNYRFRVAAVNAYGIGAWSAVGSAVPHV